MIVEEHPPQEGADAFLLPFLTLSVIKQKKWVKTQNTYCWTPSASGGGWCLLVPFLGSPCDLISSHLKSQQQTLFGHTFTFLAFLGAAPSLKTSKVAWLIPFGDIYLLQLLWHSCASNVLTHESWVIWTYIRWSCWVCKYSSWVLILKIFVMTNCVATFRRNLNNWSQENKFWISKSRMTETVWHKQGFHKVCHCPFFNSNTMENKRVNMSCYQDIWDFFIVKGGNLWGDSKKVQQRP